MKNTIPPTSAPPKETAEIKKIMLDPDLTTYLQRNLDETFKRYRLVSELLDLLQLKNKHVPTNIIDEVLQKNGITISIDEIRLNLSTSRHGKFGRTPGFLYRAIYHRGSFEDFMANATIEFMFRHFRTSLKTVEEFKTRLINETSFVELPNVEIPVTKPPTPLPAEITESPEITKIRTNTTLPAIHKAIFRNEANNQNSDQREPIIPPPPNKDNDGSESLLEMINKSNR